MNGDFYGRGFRFPIQVDPTTGSLAAVGDTEVVTQAIRLLLRTSPGERLMRPDYGCGLARFLFSPNTVATRRLISEEVRQSILHHESRVTLKVVDVTPDDVEPAQINILVSYALRRTGAAATLVEPFRLDGQKS